MVGVVNVDVCQPEFSIDELNFKLSVYIQVCTIAVLLAHTALLMYTIGNGGEKRLIAN